MPRYHCPCKGAPSANAQRRFGRKEAGLPVKIPPIINGGGGYILHTDHSEPPQIDYETMRYFLERGREVGTPNGG